MTSEELLFYVEETFADLRRLAERVLEYGDDLDWVDVKDDADSILICLNGLSREALSRGTSLPRGIARQLLLEINAITRINEEEGDSLGDEQAANIALLLMTPLYEVRLCDAANAGSNYVTAVFEGGEARLHPVVAWLIKYAQSLLVKQYGAYEMN